MCNGFHFACCVNHTWLALANHCLQNSLWDRKPSPPNSKKKTLTIPTSQKPSPHPPPPPVPIHTSTSSFVSMHGTAYRGGKHLARLLPPPRGCRQSPPHFATSACRRLSPSTFSTLFAVDPAPLGWGIYCTEGSFCNIPNFQFGMLYIRSSCISYFICFGF